MTENLPKPTQEAPAAAAPVASLSEPAAATPAPQVPVNDTEVLMDVLTNLANTMKNLKQEIDALKNDNTKLKEELGATFADIQKGFTQVADTIKALQTTTTATAAPKEEGGIMSIVNNISKAIEKAMTGAPAEGSLTDLDKEILKNSKLIQVMYTRKMLKDSTKMLGIALPEEHIVVSP